MALYMPRFRPMIPFMISVEPPTMMVARMSRYALEPLFLVGDNLLLQEFPKGIPKDVMLLCVDFSFHGCCLRDSCILSIAF